MLIIFLFTIVLSSHFEGIFFSLFFVCAKRKGKEISPRIIFLAKAQISWGIYR